MGKHTHEELFELALVNVVWEVTNKQLVAVWVPDDPPAVHVSRLSISPASCRSEEQIYQIRWSWLQESETDATYKDNKWIIYNKFQMWQLHLPLLTKLKWGFPVCDSEDATPSNSDRDMQTIRTNQKLQNKPIHPKSVDRYQVLDPAGWRPVCHVCAGLWAEEAPSVSPAWLQLWAEGVSQKKRRNEPHIIYMVRIRWRQTIRVSVWHCAHWKNHCTEELITHSS